MKRKNIIIIIILVALALTALDVLTSCKKVMATSNVPTMFIISEMSQSTLDRQNHVAEYKVCVITTDDAIIRDKDNFKRWFTLKEGFQVGDTLEFIKK